MISTFLPVYVAPTTFFDVGRLKAAKVALGITERVWLCVVDESTTRCIAVNGTPPWVYLDYFLVAPEASDYELQQAVRWCLTGEEDFEVTTVLDRLRYLLGPETREISAEELEGERRYSDYVTGAA